MHRAGLLLKATLCLLAVCSVVIAQVNTGTISGTVADATGALVPGAEITVKSVETGIARVVKTNDRGRYVAPQLPVGGYQISASATGFQTEVRTGVTLTVGEEAVVDFALNIGTVSERVEVTGEAPLVETTTVTTSGLVDETTVRELPLNGRSFSDLMDLQPNVNFRLPNNTVFLSGGARNAAAGQITDVSTSARQIQFAIKLMF